MSNDDTDRWIFYTLSMLLMFSFFFYSFRSLLNQKREKKTEFSLATSFFTQSCDHFSMSFRHAYKHFVHLLHEFYSFSFLWYIMSIEREPKQIHAKTRKLFLIVDTKKNFFKLDKGAIHLVCGASNWLYLLISISGNRHWKRSVWLSIKMIIVHIKHHMI